MKFKLLFCAFASVNILCAQETLFEDNFESGSSKWILNSSDLGIACKGSRIESTN